MSAKLGVKLDPIDCPACGFSSKLTRRLEQHLSDEHGVNAQALWNELHEGPISCGCGCKEPTQWIDWKHGYSRFIRGHNANLIAAHGEEKAHEISDKRAKALKGRKGWAHGLSKETDERIAARGRATSRGRKLAFEQGRLSVWSKGLTKETDVRVATAAQKMHVSYETGARTSWNKDKNAENDPRIACMNQTLAERYSVGELIPWSKGKNAKDDPRIAKTWLKRDPIKEYAHVRFTDEQITSKLTSNIRLRLDNIENYKNVYSVSLSMRCVTCGWSSKTTLAMALGDRCPKCDVSGSRPQREITQWIESLGFVAKNNVIGLVGGRQEVDVFIPERMLGIEFNGLYWHSEQAGRDSFYHARKTARCAAVGIKLLHIFEDDWRDRRHIMESLIRHRLGVTPRRTSARQCQLVQLVAKERRAFFEANHLDGDTAATWCMGLKHDGEVVMALSLRKPFHKGHAGRLEVARSCPRIDTVVRGGLSRLTKAALKHARSAEHIGLITYVDGRVGDGAGYVAAGFKKTGETPPRFWWTDFSRRFNRFKFKASSKEGLTERQVAAEAGVVKVWGCPNVVLMIDA